MVARSPNERSVNMILRTADDIAFRVFQLAEPLIDWFF